jgi:hypothetical protein
MGNPMNRLIKPTTERGEIIFELTITFVPIAILFVMFLVLGDWRQVLEHEEWLFVSAVLQAQAMGKLFIASDHPQIRNKYLLNTALIVLVMGILWCSLTLAKEIIPLRGGDRRHQTQKAISEPERYSAADMATNVNARLDKLEVQVRNLENHPQETPFWKSVKNIAAVIISSLLFSWAAQIERKTRNPA